MASAASIPQCLFSTVPVVQPPHLEGDPALATEILPGPPPLASIRQQPKKLDPKKPLVPLSYLPHSDPGTTYAGLAGGMSVLALQDNGPRRKRARIDRGPSNRAQRASARNLNQSVTTGPLLHPQDMDASSSHTGQDLEPSLLGDDDARSSDSRSASLQLVGSSSLPNISEMNGQRSYVREMGKGRIDKESEKVNMRVKEEPAALHLSDIPAAPANEDHCSSCSSVGALVYCDGCPRAYHLWCLNPPMDHNELPASEENWYCPSCKLSQESAPKFPHTFLSPLLQTLHYTLPVEFQLPDDIRCHFKDVGTGYGGVYVDTSTVKPPRVGRHGVGEERDPYRLKDHKGLPILCYKCGKSALPLASSSEAPLKRPRRSSRASSQSDQYRSMMSCDYCPLHWHIDCLDPPLASLPPFTKKWKCPNHANNSAPKRRIPKIAAPPIDVVGPGETNNGNIEIINMDTPIEQEERMLVDEVLINGRRYRVPERVVVLDFWNKVQQRHVGRPREIAANILSPLTSLSSLDDSESQPPSLRLDSELSDSDDTLRVAEVLCSLQTPETRLHTKRQSSRRRLTNRGTQTDPDESVRFAREDTEQLSGLMKAAFKQLDPKPGQVRKAGSRAIKSPHVVVTRPSVKQTVNGRSSSRATKPPSSYANHTSKAKKPSTPTIFRATNGSDGPNSSISSLSRTKTSEPEPKSGGSPFRIRIPGRTQLKPPAAAAPIATDLANHKDQDRSASSASASAMSLKSLPRRSSRRRPSVTSSGEQSLSSVSTFLRDNS